MPIKEKANGKVKFKKIKMKKQSPKTVILTFSGTFLIAALFSYIFEVLLADITLLIAFFVLILIISLGVLCDGIGNAVVAATEAPFHSMAAQKVKGAKESIGLIRNAPLVANIFNDVIGDVAGIISGSSATAIVLSIEEGIGRQSVLLAIAMSGFVAALTVGGKAIGKKYAIERANYIVYYLGLILHYIKIPRKLKQ